MNICTFYIGLDRANSNWTFILWLNWFRVFNGNRLGTIYFRVNTYISSIGWTREIFPQFFRVYMPSKVFLFSWSHENWKNSSSRYTAVGFLGWPIRVTRWRIHKGDTGSKLVLSNFRWFNLTLFMENLIITAINAL